MKKEGVVKTSRLMGFEDKLASIQKSRDYLEKEIFKIKEKESLTREKIRKEKKAISLMNMAKKLR